MSSSIAGMLCFHGAPVPVTQLDSLASRLSGGYAGQIRHWREGSIGLGAFQALDGQAPAIAADTEGQGPNLIIAFEGRLDNRQSLRQALRSTNAGCAPAASDALLVLRSYEAWGSDCATKLLGDFAYAVWDSRARELHLAVDPSGARHLYYTQTPGFFAFASTEEALLALPSVTGKPNEAKVVNFLFPAFRDIAPSDSWLRDVSVLPPGEGLTIYPDGRSLHRAGPGRHAGAELAFADETQAVEEFRSIFLEAVRCRIPSSGDGAQLLSGGLDSASIHAAAAVVAAERKSARLRTYSALADDVLQDIESRCIASMADDHAVRMQLPSFEGPVTWSDARQEAWGGAHPNDNSLLIPALLCLAARRAGHHAMLHGVSGDITQQVPLRYPAYLLRAGDWRAAWHECKMASRNSTLLEGTPAARTFAQNLWTAYVPAALNRWAHRGLLATATFRAAHANLHPDLAGRHSVRQRLVETMVTQRRSLEPSLVADHASIVENPFGLQLGLRGFARIGKRYGLEMSDPWSDQRVVDFFVRLPLRYKVHDGWTKILVRKTFSDVLPAPVVWRRDKQHLGWRITQKLMGPESPELADLLEQAIPHATPYVSKDAPARARAYLRARARGGEHSFAQHKVAYDLLVLGLWLARISGVAGRSGDTDPHERIEDGNRRQHYQSTS